MNQPIDYTIYSQNNMLTAPSIIFTHQLSVQILACSHPYRLV